MGNSTEKTQPTTVAWVVTSLSFTLVFKAITVLLPFCSLKEDPSVGVVLLGPNARYDVATIEACVSSGLGKGLFFCRLPYVIIRG